MVLAALAAAVLILRPRPTTYTVVSGDTLFEIARDHGVTVAELREWNGIEGDLIEVGQVLSIWEPASPAPEVVRGAPKKRRAVQRSARPGETALFLPAEQPCLAPPSPDLLDGDEGLLGSRGLSHAQVREAMDRFVGHTLACVPEGTTPAGTIHTRIRVACTGRVAEVTVVDGGGLPPEMVACVRETLYYTPFPAHDLPNGEVFEYPLTFRFDP